METKFTSCIGLCGPNDYICFSECSREYDENLKEGLKKNFLEQIFAFFEVTTVKKNLFNRIVLAMKIVLVDVRVKTTPALRLQLLQHWLQPQLLPLLRLDIKFFRFF